MGVTDGVRVSVRLRVRASGVGVLAAGGAPALIAALSCICGHSGLRKLRCATALDPQADTQYLPGVGSGTHAALVSVFPFLPLAS